MTEIDDQSQDDGGSSEHQGGGDITHDQMNKLLARQKTELEQKFRGSDYEAIVEKATQFDELTASTRTAQEALAEYMQKAEEAENELAWRDTLLLRQEMAAKKQLDAKLWSRIQGETPAEIEADIDDLLSSFAVRQTKPSGLKSGASSDGNLTKKERAAQALRGARER